jgi:hypothetical protein
VGHLNVRHLTALLGEAEVGPEVCHDGGHALGGADRGGGLQNHHVAVAEDRSYRAGRVLHVRDVGLGMLAIAAQGSRHSDDEGVRRLKLQRGAQLAVFDHAADQGIEIRFAEMRAAGVDRVHHAWADVDADDLQPILGKYGRGGQADIAETDHGDAVETIHPVVCFRQFSAASLSRFANICQLYDRCTGKPLLISRARVELHHGEAAVPGDGCNLFRGATRFGKLGCGQFAQPMHVRAA